MLTNYQTYNGPGKFKTHIQYDENIIETIEQHPNQLKFCTENRKQQKLKIVTFQNDPISTHN